MKRIMLLSVILLMNMSLFSKGIFYAVYVIDNEIPNVNCADSLFAWQEAMNKIHHYTNMKTKERVLTVGLPDSMEEWSREVVLAALDDVKPDNHDTVLFFFAGKSDSLPADQTGKQTHSLSKQKSRYPKMLLQYGTTLELEEAAAVLAEKRPGLMLVFADFYDLHGSSFSEEKSTVRANRSVVYGNYRNLFCEKRHAAVIAASCEVGNKGENGVFTHQFFKALDECTISGNASWQALLKKISEPAGKMRNKACWEIRAQKDFTADYNIAAGKYELPDWKDSWDENWYDYREWYDDGGWNGELYQNDEEYYAEDEKVNSEE